MSPSIEQLDRFVRSARAGSYSAAAQELYVTPQTVSKSVHDMEHKLNIVLFEPTGRRLRPTARGAQVLHRASEVLEGWTISGESAATMLYLARRGLPDCASRWPARLCAAACCSSATFGVSGAVARTLRLTCHFFPAARACRSWNPARWTRRWWRGVRGPRGLCRSAWARSSCVCWCRAGMRLPRARRLPLPTWKAPCLPSRMIPAGLRRRCLSSFPGTACVRAWRRWRCRRRGIAAFCMRRKGRCSSCPMPVIPSSSRMWRRCRSRKGRAWSCRHILCGDGRRMPPGWPL